MLQVILPILLTTLASQPVAAQIIDTTEVPACLASCPTVYQAQQLCSPPVTASADTTCFCNSNYLAQMKSGRTAGLCDGYCTDAEMSQFLTYFNGLCNLNNQNVPTSTTTTSSASSLATSSRAKPTYDAPPSWISTHYGWVIFVIILILAAICALVFSWWYKRRRARAQNLNSSSVLATHDAIAAVRDPHPRISTAASRTPAALSKPPAQDITEQVQPTPIQSGQEMASNPLASRTTSLTRTPSSTANITSNTLVPSSGIENSHQSKEDEERAITAVEAGGVAQPSGTVTLIRPVSAKRSAGKLQRKSSRSSQALQD